MNLRYISWTKVLISFVAISVVGAGVFYFLFAGKGVEGERKLVGIEVINPRGAGSVDITLTTPAESGAMTIGGLTISPQPEVLMSYEIDENPNELPDSSTITDTYTGIVQSQSELHHYLYYGNMTFLVTESSASSLYIGGQQADTISLAKDSLLRKMKDESAANSSGSVSLLTYGLIDSEDARINGAYLITDNGSDAISRLNVYLWSDARVIHIEGLIRENVGYPEFIKSLTVM